MAVLAVGLWRRLLWLCSHSGSAGREVEVLVMVECWWLWM
jgi:hypothetical protein